MQQALALDLPSARVSGLLRAAAHAPADAPLQVFQVTPSSVLAYELAGDAALGSPRSPAALFTRPASSHAKEALPTLCACVLGHQGLVACVQSTGDVFLRADALSMGSGRPVLNLGLAPGEQVTCMCGPPSQPDVALFVGTSAGRVLFVGISGNDQTPLFCEQVDLVMKQSLLPSLFSSFVTQSQPSPITAVDFCKDFVAALTHAGDVYVFDPTSFALVGQYGLKDARDSVLVAGASRMAVLLPEAYTVMQLGLNQATHWLNLPASAALHGSAVAGAALSETHIYFGLNEPNGFELFAVNLSDPKLVERRMVTGARLVGLTGDNQPCVLSEAHLVVLEHKTKPPSSSSASSSRAAPRGLGTLSTEDFRAAMDAPALSMIHVPTILQSKLGSLKSMLGRINWDDEQALLLGESLHGLIACPPHAFEDVSRLYTRLDTFTTDDLIKIVRGSNELYQLLPDVPCRQVLASHAAPMLLARFEQSPSLLLAELTLDAHLARYTRKPTPETQNELIRAEKKCIDPYIHSNVEEALRLSDKFLYFEGIIRSCLKLGHEGMVRLDSRALKAIDCEMIVSGTRVHAKRTGVTLVSTKEGFAFSPNPLPETTRVNLSEVMRTDAVDLQTCDEEGAVWITDARTGKVLGVDPATMQCILVDHIDDWDHFPGVCFDWFLSHDQVKDALEMASRLNLSSVLVDVLNGRNDRSDVLWVAMLGAKRLGEAAAVLASLGNKPSAQQETCAGLAELCLKAGGIAVSNAPGTPPRSPQRTR